VTTALDQLVELLDLAPDGPSAFSGQSPEEERQRVFGGQVAAQALVAAGRTVDPDRHVHSLHAYFLRPGLVGEPIRYEVDRIRDGRSFTTRRVVAVQRGQAIFNLSASFHVEEEGLDHQDPAPDAPAPESLAGFAEQMAPYAEELGEWYLRPRAIDQRFVDAPSHASLGQPNRASLRVWIRADGRLPPDPLLHACVVAYASDMTLLDTVLLAHGMSWRQPGISGASLDHAMWFHRPFRADEWLLYEQRSPTASGARGLATGSIFTVDGRLAVTVVQEGLLRYRPPDPRAGSGARRLDTGPSEPRTGSR
jgi:acyl-CoA thioesterase-2